MLLLNWQMNKKIVFDHMKFDIFKFSRKTNLMTIEELRHSRLLKQRIENEKQSRKYISEINQRYRKWSDKKNQNFPKKVS